MWAVITALIVSSISFAYAISPSMQKSHANYDPHSVIVADGETALSAQAAAEGWRGNGTEVDPFVIEGYEILAMGHDEGIRIANTSSHIVIEGCYVRDATLACISLFNVTNVTISRTELVNGERGIQVISSSFVSVVGNNCTMAVEGIWLSGSQWCTVAGNNCSGNIIGLGAQSCGNLSMSLNMAYANMISGIRLMSTEDFMLANNTCSGGQFGVQVMQGERGTVLNSTAVGSSDSGVLLSSCVACSVIGNKCSGHGSFGISLVDSPGCRLMSNDARDNGCGIRALRCDQLQTGMNLVKDNRGRGIVVAEGSGCTLADNLCVGNGGDGMVIDSSSGCQAARNTFERNGGAGLRCHALVRSEIVSNHVVGSRGDGLHLALSSDVNVSDNVCSDAFAGIRLSMCASSSVHDNVINRSVLGVAAAGSTELVLRRNVMTDGGLFLEGPAPAHWSTHDIDATNTVNGRPVAYLVSVSGIVVPGTPGQILMADCIDITVDGLDLSNASVGVALGFSSRVTVNNSTCSGGYIGVFGQSSSGLRVVDCECSGNSRSGVELNMCGACDLVRLLCEDNVESGVRLNASTACEVRSCEISGSRYGVLTENTPSAGLIEDCLIFNCTSGVRAQSAEGVRLESNGIRACDFGVALVDSPSMSMAGNAFVGCGLYIESDLITGWSTHSAGPDNSVNGKALAYLVGASWTTLAPGLGQVVLAGCSWIDVSYLNLSGSSVGVLAGFSTHVSILGCNLSDNVIGAELANCANCTVSSNSIADCALDGVRMSGSGSSVIEGNSIQRCDIGIHLMEGLQASTGNVLRGNNASHCTLGVSISSCRETTIEQNMLESSIVCGLLLEASNQSVVRNNTVDGSRDVAISIRGSEGCTIANNSCVANHRGIYLWRAVGCNVSGNLLLGSKEYGVRLDSASRNNAVWGNAFAYNNGTSDTFDPRNAQACDDGIGNRWNTSGGQSGSGNYWHDLTAPDSDKDGIVDVPYTLSGSASAKDYRPLANASILVEAAEQLMVHPTATYPSPLATCSGCRKEE